MDTPAVEALVMKMHAGDERMKELDRGEDVAAVAGVLFEDLVLVVGELARLVEVEHAANLADVVHERALSHDLHFFWGEAESRGEVDGVDRDATAVPRV